jgi:hypothetical protein
MLLLLRPLQTATTNDECANQCRGEQSEKV